MRPIKILFVVSTLDQGGMENYLLRLITFAGQRLNASVLCKTGVKGKMAPAFEEKGIPVSAIKQGYFNPFGALRIYRFINSYAPDVVCDMTGNFSGIVMLIAWLSGVSKRITFYRSASHDFKVTFFTNAYNVAVKKSGFVFSTDILFNSAAGKQFFYGSIADARMKITYNGIQVADGAPNKSRKRVREELAIPDEAFVVLHMGRLNYAKNHECILEVAESLTLNDKQIYFVLAGKDVRSLESQISPASAAQIRLLDHQTDVRSLILAADLFFFPSLTEGQPNALIEAMVEGLPIIASDIPAIRECTPESFHPRLTSPNDRERFTKLIHEIHHREQDRSAFMLDRYARQEFDAIRRFGEVLKVFGCNDLPSKLIEKD